MPKGQLLEAILKQKEAVHKDGWNVATSQRRDVGSTNIKVNKRQHREVSANSVFSSLKAKRGAELGVSGIVRTRARKSEQSDIDLEEEPVIYIFLCFG